MKGPEKMSENIAEFDAIVREATIGHLGILTPDGFPRVVPVNFVAVGQTIYFHGATSGEKYEAFAARQKVTLSISIPYAPIPSYWRAKDYACPANQFYKSVLIRGKARLAETPEEKADGLQALIEKHQPEGGYLRISADEPLYKKPIDEVAVYCIDPVKVDVRTSFGQSYKPEMREELIRKLEERGDPMDHETAEEIRKTLGK
ncbi:MAG: pyridoxamine 5'-phosphate oxidase family protein [bacterium]|nr:pyridoxamine 5'-phosphate oxidase family protein [bacterium]